MVTKNFASLVTMALTGDNSSLINYDGQTTSVPSTYIVESFKTDLLNKNYSELKGVIGAILALGSGNTPAAVDDLTLNNVIDDYTVVSQTHTLFSKQISDTMCVYSRTVKNTSDAPLTISEMGIFIGHNSWQLSAMVARDVLDTPVVLQPGKKYTFTMTIALD